MTPTPDELVRSLDALGVPFLVGQTSSADTPTLTTVELLKALANAPEARLRAAVIPLLLRHPELAQTAREAAEQLSDAPRQTLKCFYTVAFLLQRKYGELLARLLRSQSELPDLFSAELGLSLEPDVQVSLRELAGKHGALTGLLINWLGTYEHAAERWIKQLENQVRWAQPRAG
jgi:hypothetical protein